MTNKTINYKQAGVDIQAGDELVGWLQKQKLISTVETVSGVGGFASITKFPANKYKNPCLVSCTDGVGTKVKLAAQLRKYRGVGQDLVAMCVNDLICTGGTPMLFLDYYATSKLDLESAKEFLTGIRQACEKSLCTLVGGETAEMPGVYHNNDFDCAGFAVGVVDESEIWGSHKVKAGDVVIGVSSSGFHSNGYSLVRKLFEKDIEKYADELMAPTHLYVELAEKIKSKKIDLHACAHITGGGIQNLPRVIPHDHVAQIKKWKFPEIFIEAQKRSGLSDFEMMDTFNCGVGLMLVAPEKVKMQLLEVISELDFTGFELGEVIKSEGEARVEVK